jgi:hypothetical protein
MAAAVFLKFYYKMTKWLKSFVHTGLNKTSVLKIFCRTGKANKFVASLKTNKVYEQS